MSRNVLLYSVVHLPLGIAAYATTFIPGCWMRWSLGIVAVAASTVFSLYFIIYKKTLVWDKIKNKISK